MHRVLDDNFLFQELRLAIPLHGVLGEEVQLLLKADVPGVAPSIEGGLALRGKVGPQCGNGTEEEIVGFDH